MSVVSCRFPNSITSTCCQLVADLLATRQTILTCKIVCRVANKSATSCDVEKKVRGNVCNGLLTLNCRMVKNGKLQKLQMSIASSSRNSAPPTARRQGRGFVPRDDDILPNYVYCHCVTSRSDHAHRSDSSTVR